PSPVRAFGAAIDFRPSSEAGFSTLGGRNSRPSGNVRLTVFGFDQYGRHLGTKPALPISGTGVVSILGCRRRAPFIPVIGTSGAAPTRSIVRVSMCELDALITK